MSYNCTICYDRGVIIKGKKRELCKCKLLKGWQKSLSPLMVNGNLTKPNIRMQNMIKSLVNFEKKRDKKKNIPKRYYLINDDTRTAIDNISAREYWRSVFAYYMIETKKFLDVRILPMYFLMDLYMGKVNIGLKEGEIEDSFYGLPNKTFIIYFDSFFRNVILLNVLQQFLDLYKDRNILFYLDTDAYKGKVVYRDDDDNDKFDDFGIVPVLDKGGLIDMHKLVSNKKGLDGIYE